MVDIDNDSDTTTPITKMTYEQWKEILVANLDY